MGHLEDIQCDGADCAGLGRVRRWNWRLGVSQKAIAFPDAHGTAYELSRICVRIAIAGHRRGASVEFLLDGVSVEMEHALATSGSGDLHVDLRDDPAGGGKHSACVGETLVFRFTAAAGSRADREAAALLLSVDHRGGLSIARNAPIIIGSVDVAGGRASASTVADAVAAGSVCRGGYVHVVWMCGGNDDAVLPGLEKGHGHGSARGGSTNHLVANLWMVCPEIAGHSVSWGVGNSFQVRSVCGGVLAGDVVSCGRRFAAVAITEDSRSAAHVCGLHPEFGGRNDLPLQPDHTGIPAKPRSPVLPSDDRDSGFARLHFPGNHGISDCGKAVRHSSGAAE